VNRQRAYRAGTTLTTAVFIATVFAAHAADYRVGDRLPNASSKDSSQNTVGRFRDIDWLALVPKDWDPMAEVGSLDLANMKDSDPRAVQALQRLKEAVRNAPVQPELEGAKVRIPGFAIPLERAGDKVTELLLVPYFGACIHVPPPPPNQIIHVKLARPASVRTMETVYVSGTLRIARADTEWGRVAYAMDAESVAPYEQGGFRLF
jgi:uncharacterized protein